MSCKRCGQCCERTLFRHINEHRDEIPEEELKRLTEIWKGHRYMGKGPLPGEVLVMVENPCKYLGHDEDGKAFCAIYGRPNRPEMCSTFQCSKCAEDP